VLYVSDTGLLADQEDARHIRRYPIEALSVSGPGEDFVSVPVGLSDGFEIDEDGRIWTSAGDGVYVFEANGGLIGRIPVPEVVANVTFGGDDRDELFIAASSCLYRIRTRTRGAAR
jgi:gluconolactonase